MTTLEAYEFTLEKIDELKKDDIHVIIKPSKSRNSKIITNKYNGPERISPDKWIHITFLFLEGDQATKILEMANYLMMCGIYFDTGGSTKHSRNDVEDIINNL